jgi:hypothetical protein
MNLDAPMIAVIGLNPSTATEKEDDPTMRRLKDFCARWGYGGFVMLNLFAFRATQPEDMKAAENPEGDPDNVAVISKTMLDDNIVAIVAAWGTHGAFNDRGKTIIDKAETCGRTLWCLGKNQDGSPKHPLYVAGETQLERY